MFTTRLTTLSAVILGAAIIAGPATAQKSKGEVRIGIIDAFHTLDNYHSPSNQVGQYARAFYGKLIVYDEHRAKLVPELAKSWKRINPTTVEYELRDDITFTSGNKFSAEDIKYTLAYVGDPKLRIRFKSRYTWVKEVQILGPHKIRIVAKKPRPDDLMGVAYRFYIYDKKVHSQLKNKALYGAISASTTGVYKLVSINRNDGPRLVRHEAAVGKFPHRRAPIKHVRGIPVPDRATQVAALLTGEVHSIRNPTPDMVRSLAKNPKIKITPFATRYINYITLDAAGRSKNKKFMDIRVRQAFIKAINREAVIKNYVPGQEIALRPKTICYDDNIACSYTTKPLDYDPAGARKLLKEAGYPNGFDMELSAFAPYKEIAEAISGELLKVGIRAKVVAMPLSVYTKRRGRGELTALYAGYPTFAQPNTLNLMNFFFGANRDYNKDPLIQKARKMGSKELDVKKRAAIFQKAMDQINKMSYILPFIEQPNVYAHSKDIQIKPGLTSKTETRITDYFWK